MGGVTPNPSSNRLEMMRYLWSFSKDPYRSGDIDSVRGSPGCGARQMGWRLWLMRSRKDW